MTTYDAQEQSTHDGSPLELYKFESEVAPTFYTNNNSPVLFAGDWYMPEHISRGTADVGGLVDSPVTVNVNVSVSSALFLEYGLDLTPPTLNVTVYKQQRGADGYKRQLVGKCTGHSVSGQTYTLEMQNLLQTQFNASIAQVIFDNKCNNLFGDVRCKFNVAALIVAADITAHDDFNYTIDATLEMNKYVGGVLNVGGQERLIVANGVHTVTVAYPLLKEDGVTTCTVKPGCNLSRTACVAYDNLDNFSGFMCIPTDNPLAADLSDINTKFLASKNSQDVSRWRPANATIVGDTTGSFSAVTKFLLTPLADD